MMSHRGRKWMCLVGGTLAAFAVAGLYFAKSARLGFQPRAYLLRENFNGVAIDRAMLVDQAACRKFLSQDHPYEFVVSPDFACVPEDDPSVPAKWRARTRIVGRWQGRDVYYYHEPEPVTLRGAFVLALPNENDDPEIFLIFVDQTTCDQVLERDKDSWKSDLELQRDAEHDPKLRAEIPNWEGVFKEDKRAASGACIPITNAMPLVSRFCEGLPLRLKLFPVGGTYECDRNILKPAGAAPD